MQARWAAATPAAQVRGHLGNQRLKARWGGNAPSPKTVGRRSGASQRVEQTRLA